ncbi:hypothetical protein BDB00DRAFT_765343, partial [Zychaea mexicana]|uniref:uncharacterized protein n=2 Tax=Zychaea mexicana TaxID=64656 RepID=UPI0022FE457B
SFYSTEISSEANANAINSSRQLSSITAISNRRMGRRGNTIFKYGSKELGCSEVGAARDQTKAFRDSAIKLPLVLIDMLLSVTYHPSLLHACHVIGYSVSGQYTFCTKLLDKRCYFIHEACINIEVLLDIFIR